MTKYIDLEQAVDLFYPVDPENDGSDGCTVICKAGTYDSCEIESMLRELPAADVAPVVHSEWGINFVGNFPYCENCGKKPKNGMLTKFCPNCGSKMDGGNLNEN